MATTLTLTNKNGEEGKQLNLNLEKEYVMSFSITPTIGSESNDFVMGVDYPVIRPDIDIGDGDILNKGTVFVNGRPMTVTRMDGKFMVTLHKVCPDPVVRSWGLVPTFVTPDKGCATFRNWLWDALDMHSSLLIGSSISDDISWEDMAQRFRCFKPFQSEINLNNIALYPSIEKYLAKREVSMKAGKALKLMIPELSQVDLDKIVDSFRTNFDQREFTLHTSRLADKFELAYNGDQVPMQNPVTTCLRKSLAHSCMRKDCDQFEYHVDEHPSRAYASGDFSIIYTEINGKIGSRCTVWTHQDGEPIIPQAAPIYGTCEHSIDMITNKLKEMGAEFADHASWIGAKLRRIPFEGNDDQFIGPYLDLSPQELTDTGEYLVVKRGGEVNASEYNGVLGDTYDCYCDDCGCGMYQDDYYYSEYYETSYCESCYGDLHAHCELSEEDYPRDEMVEVLSAHGQAIWAWCQHEDIVVACDGNRWVHEDLTFCEYDDTYVPSYDLIKYDYFQSDWDNEIYPMSECCILADCSSVSKDELDNDENDWVLGEKSGTWSPTTEGEDK